MFATVVLSIVPLRRLAFQMWLVSHILLALAAIAVCFLHNVTTVVFVLLWWILDMTVRYLLMAGWRYQATASLEVLVGGEDDRKIVKVSFPKPTGFDYAPGQFVQVAIPAVSLLEFHPITICSAPHEENVTFLFRGLGDWTNALVELAKVKKETAVMVEGPYGAVGADLDDVERYKTFLLVAGGIGNTVCESIGRSLLHQHETNTRTLTKVRYVWACRKLGMVQDMPPLAGYQPSYAAGMCGRRTSRRPTKVLEDPFQSGAITLAEETNVPVKVDIEVYSTREDAEETLDFEDFRVNESRPDFEAILCEMRKEAIEAGETSVAVIGCGPAGMMDALREACRKQSDMIAGCGSEVVFFDLHTERFEF